ncbi:hypothetical protein MRX96_045307 [Rhipicephalus microplus]
MRLLRRVMKGCADKGAEILNAEGFTNEEEAKERPKGLSIAMRKFGRTTVKLWRSRTTRERPWSLRIVRSRSLMWMPEEKTALRERPLKTGKQLLTLKSSITRRATARLKIPSGTKT